MVRHGWCVFHPDRPQETRGMVFEAEKAVAIRAFVMAQTKVYGYCCMSEWQRRGFVVAYLELREVGQEVQT